MKKPSKRMQRTSAVLAAMLVFLMPTLLASVAHAESAKVIDTKVDETLVKFEKQIKGGKEFLQSSKGVLVFPSVFQAGVGIGGKYGEGALRIDNKTVDYYSTAAGSIGFQLGAQTTSIILVFMQEKALEKFRKSYGWQVGVDGSVTLIKIGAGGSIDTTKLKDPIVGFVFGRSGLMYNLSLEGMKFTKLNRKKESEASNK